MDASQINNDILPNNSSIFSYVYQVVRKYITNNIFKNREQVIDV
jgi:hypothetical protein